MNTRNADKFKANKAAARETLEKIRAYWAARGYFMSYGTDIWLDCATVCKRDDGGSQGPLWFVRSKMVNGLPPGRKHHSIDTMVGKAKAAAE